jgi:hypothetical protein
MSGAMMFASIVMAEGSDDSLHLEKVSDKIYAVVGPAYTPGGSLVWLPVLCSWRHVRAVPCRISNATSAG